MYQSEKSICHSFMISVAVNDPYLLPKTDTESYHMNKISPMCPVECLRWCWGAYLQFDCQQYRETHNQEINFESLDSYSLALSQCKWMMGQDDTSQKMRRLITPQLDLPSGICRGDGAPTLIITTSRADPLLDDGIDLLQKLKDINGGELSSNVTHIMTKGSHASILLFDHKMRNEFLKLLHAAIFQ